AAGAVSDERLFRAVVVNRAKLAYDSVAAWLEGQAAAPPKVTAVPGLADNLRLQDSVAQALRQRRHQRGALDLDTLGGDAGFDGDRVSDLRLDRKNRAKQLIEDFMVAGNVVTAGYLEQKKFPSVRRVLRVPQRWDRIVELAAACGARLPDAPDGRALQAFLV